MMLLPKIKYRCKQRLTHATTEGLGVLDLLARAVVQMTHEMSVDEMLFEGLRADSQRGKDVIIGR